MARKQPPRLERLPDGSLRRGVLGNETKSYPVSMSVPAPLGFEGIGDDQFDAGSVAKFKRWKRDALQVLKDAGLPIVPEDNLATRVRRQQVPFSEMREQESLSEIMAAAELVDAINDILGDIERNVAAPFHIEKLVGAYHGFVMLHLGINNDAARGQKSVAALKGGSLEMKRKAQQCAAIAMEIFGLAPVYWGDPGTSETVKTKHEALAKKLIEKGLIRDPKQVNERNLKRWRKRL